MALKVTKANIARVIGKEYMSQSYTTCIRGWRDYTRGYLVELCKDGTARLTYYHGDFKPEADVRLNRLKSRVEALREKFVVEVVEGGEALIVRAAV